MNLLAHLWLAERTGTSFSGQILGDVVKGRLDGRYPLDVRNGIRIHRAIDRFSDDHAEHVDMRRLFAPPLRRYAGIIVDIGFDYSLARGWPDYAGKRLPVFAQAAEKRVRREWPRQAPFGATRMLGLGRILSGYDEPAGIQRALESVGRRLSRRNPVADALPELLERRAEFDARLPRLLADLEVFTRRLAQDLTDPDDRATSVAGTPESS